MTTAELLVAIGRHLSRQRLHQLRGGHRGTPPRLLEGIDWEFERGNIVYHKSAVDKLKNSR